VQGSEDDIEGARHGVTWLRSSLDDGATWQGPAPIATGLRRLDALAVANDGLSVFTISEELDALFFQAAGFAAPEARMLDLNLKPDGAELGSADGGDVVQTPQGRVIAAIDTVDDTLWRAFGGGDPYDQAAWQPFPAKRIRNEGTPSLSSGPRGTYLMKLPRRPGPARPGGAVRDPLLRHPAHRWRAPKAAAEDRLVFGGGTLQQDARGRLHLLWQTQTSGNTSCIVYARTGTRSSSWFGRSTTLFRTTADALEPTGGDRARRRRRRARRGGVGHARARRQPGARARDAAQAARGALPPHRDLVPPAPTADLGSRRIEGVEAGAGPSSPAHSRGRSRTRTRGR